MYENSPADAVVVMAIAMLPLGGPHELVGTWATRRVRTGFPSCSCHVTAWPAAEIAGPARRVTRAIAG